MRRRRPEGGEELLPLELDDEGAPADGRIVEVGGGHGTQGGRRRGRDLALVAAAVALVAALGLLGDDGRTGPQDEAAAETPTTTERRTATTRPRTRTRPTTSTTALGDDVEFELGDGPIVPSQTGSTVAVGLSGGEVAMIDLDSGGRCTVDLGGSDVGWQPTTDGTHAVAFTRQGPVAIDPGCTVEPWPDDQQDGDRIAGDRPGFVWRQEWLNTEVRLVEAGPDGEPTGRELRTRADVQGVQAVTGGLVVDVHGSITLLDADTGAAREVAKGQLLAARADRIVLVECTAFHCPVRVRDLDGALVSSLEEGLPTYLWPESLAISPDGRRFGVHVQDGDGRPQAVLVDLDTGVHRALGPTNGGTLAFTLDSRYLVGMFDEGLQAIDVETDDRHLVLRPGNDLQSFVVIARS